MPPPVSIDLGLPQYGTKLSPSPGWASLASWAETIWMPSPTRLCQVTLDTWHSMLIIDWISRQVMSCCCELSVIIFDWSCLQTKQKQLLLDWKLMWLLDGKVACNRPCLLLLQHFEHPQTISSWINIHIFQRHCPVSAAFWLHTRCCVFFLIYLHASLNKWTLPQFFPDWIPAMLPTWGIFKLISFTSPLWFHTFLKKKITHQNVIGRVWLEPWKIASTSSEVYSASTPCLFLVYFSG